MKFPILLLIAVLAQSVSLSVSAQDLPPAVLHQVLEKRVYKAVKSRDFKKADQLIEQMRKLDVPATPDFLYLDGRVSHALKRHNRAQTALTGFLSSTSPDSPHYEKALEILAEIMEAREVFEVSDEARACDQLAASPFDRARPKEVSGVALRKLDAKKATAACDTALALVGDHPRMLVNAARAALVAGDKGGALRRFEKAAAQGYGAAFFPLGQLLREGADAKENIKTSIGWLKKASEQGDSRAAAALGQLYYKQDQIPLAAHWLEIARQNGDKGAIRTLYEIYRNLEDNTYKKQALALLEDTADAGDVWAAKELVENQFAPGAPKLSSAKAYSWGKRAAQLGSFRGYVLFTDALTRGEGDYSDYLLISKGTRNWVGSANNYGGKAYQEVLRLEKMFQTLSDERFVRELCIEATTFDTDSLRPAGLLPVPLKKVDFAKALVRCTKALEKNPNDPHLTALLGRAHQASGDMEQAISLYSRSAVNTYPSGFDLLGDAYLTLAKDTNNDPAIMAKSFKAYQTGGDLNHTGAILGLGLAYKEGYGVDPAPEKAFELIKRAAETGLPVAQYELGHLFYTGTGTAKNKVVALKWIESAAKQGYANAQYGAGYVHYRSKQYDKARLWFEKAARHDTASALHFLGWMHANGLGVPKDQQKALRHYERGAALGYAASQNNLAYAYQYGKGVVMNISRAEEFYKLSAAQNYKSALRNIALMYRDNPSFFLNMRKAQYWINRAAQAGVKNAESDKAKINARIPADGQREINSCDRFAALASDPSKPKHVPGITFKQVDALIAIDVCSQAIDNSPQTERFKYQLGRAYDIQKNYDQAVQWYKAAAEDGHAIAQFTLGWIYLYAEWIDHDRDKAVKLLTLAAKQKLPQAQFHLGKLYFLGDGVREDRDRGIALLKQAAKQDNKSARKFLRDNKL